MNPLISIIIPNYNYAAYVADAVNSVLAQTYQHIECIVVDDGSTDNSLQILSHFRNITVIAQPNSGQLAADAKGFSAAKGDIILFLDSDDQLLPSACQEIADAFQPGVSMIQFGLTKVDTSGNPLGRFPDLLFRPIDHKKAFLKHGIFPSSPNSGNAFSRAHVQNMLSTVDLTTEGRSWIDGYLIFSAPFTGTVAVIDKSLGLYLVHGANVSMSGQRTVKKITNATASAIFQRKGVYRLLNGPHPEAELAFALSKLPPNHLRNAVLLRRLGAGDLIPEQSTFSLCASAIAKYLTTPFLEASRKATGIVSVLAAALLPYYLLNKTICSQ